MGLCHALPTSGAIQCELRRWSLEVAPQQQGVYNSYCSHLVPFVSMSTFLVCRTKITGELPSLAYYSFHYLTNKLSKSKSGLLYLYQSNQSGLDLGLACLVCSCLDRNQCGVLLNTKCVHPKLYN